MNWLLCDFHIHTKFSDGKLPLREVVDLFGKHGFDVISITDHILDKYTLEERIRKGEQINAITKENFKDYLKTLWKEAKRDLYHILAIDIKEYVEPSLPVEEIIKEVKEQNAIVIAAHPDRKKEDKEHLSWYLWENQEKFKEMFDAWEVANRDDLFNSIGVKKYNYIANSDFHEPWHLYSWKTLIKAEKNIEAIKDAIRKNENVAIYLMRKTNEKR